MRKIYGIVKLHRVMQKTETGTEWCGWYSTAETVRGNQGSINTSERVSDWRTE